MLSTIIISLQILVIYFVFLRIHYKKLTRSLRSTESTHKLQRMNKLISEHNVKFFFFHSRIFRSFQSFLNFEFTYLAPAEMCDLFRFLEPNEQDAMEAYVKNISAVKLTPVKVKEMIKRSEISFYLLHNPNQRWLSFLHSEKRRRINELFDLAKLSYEPYELRNIMEMLPFRSDTYYEVRKILRKVESMENEETLSEPRQMSAS